MQAILTKYHGPSNVKGSRISASAQAGRIIVSYDDALNLDENHRSAAWKLLAKVGWEHSDYVLESGTLPSGDQCHVYFHKS